MHSPPSPPRGRTLWRSDYPPRNQEESPEEDNEEDDEDEEDEGDEGSEPELVEYLASLD